MKCDNFKFIIVVKSLTLKLILKFSRCNMKYLQQGCVCVRLIHSLNIAFKKYVLFKI